MIQENETLASARDKCEKRLVAAAHRYVEAGRSHLAGLNARGSVAEAYRFAKRLEWRILEEAVREFDALQLADRLTRDASDQDAAQKVKP